MSAILSADDLNDFISPGVACIKPPAENVNLDTNNENGEVDIQIDNEGNPIEISRLDGTATSLSAAQISLADCLACSGCITSAEEILVAQHSHNELIKALKEKVQNKTDKVFVASISHQSRASLATAYNLTVEEVDRLLVNLFINQMGFSYIVGTSLGRKLSLIYESQNIINKKEEKFEGPTLSSICPGWVLYAEKTHPYVLPRISDVKSPQQITGCLLKTLTARDLNTTRDNIYHLSIMPCFDKKLESARPEKGEPESAPNDVDCVLTAKELITLLDEHSDDFSLFPPQVESILSASSVSTTELYTKCAPNNWPFVDLSWSNDNGSSSGGYAYHYIKLAQEHLILKDPSTYQPENFTLKTILGRNSDIYELRLIYKDVTVASAAIVNGFRNIQNLVRKLKPSTKQTSTVKANPLASRRRARLASKTDGTASSNNATQDTADASKCDYVEIMACPNGCITGGGQINPPADVPEKEWLAKASENYTNIPSYDLLSAGSNGNMLSELIEWCQEFCKEFDLNQNRLLKTWFHEVEQSTDPNAILLGAKW